MLTMPPLPVSGQYKTALNAAQKVNRSEIKAMRGINYGDALKDGDMADSLNISARRYPYIATRRAREKQAGYADATALTGWDKLIAVEGTSLLYDGTAVGTVSEGVKQFAVVNTKLVIWPDKKYLDLKTLTVKDMAATATGTAVTFTTDSATFTGMSDLTTLFNAGDGLTISGCTSDPSNNRDVVVKSVTSNKITVADNTFTAGSESGTIKLERKVPDMDYICESENRLWGCSSTEQTIYASALGDPCNFNVFESLSTDSYALAVGSEGNFTGCCKLSSSVLFWKENTLHKILGSYPAEYAMYPYTVEGLQEGCNKSLQVMNDVLFYMGLHGVYIYSGGTPSLASANFGDREFSDAVAGNDGDSYYLSCKDESNQWHLMIYEKRSGVWVHEDYLECVDFARIGKSLYFLDADGDVWLASSGQDDPDMEWMVQFTPFYESIQGRKCYSRLLLRTELPVGSYVTVSLRQDGGPWREAGRVVGKSDDVARIRVPITRCDKFEIKLEGKGPCTILSMERTFTMESEV